MEKNNKKIDRDTVIKVIQAVLCIVYVVFMCVQVIGIHYAGSLAKAANPRAQIYTPEIAADALLRGLPVLIAAIAVTVIAAALGIRNNEKPFNDPDVAFILKDERVKKDTELAKSGEKKAVEKQLGKKHSKAVSIVRCVLLVISVLFIILGIYNGGADAVLTKAITICTECIGLG